MLAIVSLSLTSLLDSMTFGFNQVPMGGVGHTQSMSDGDIPRFVQSVCLTRHKVPQTRAIEAGSIDVEELDSYRRINEMKLL